MPRKLSTGCITCRIRRVKCGEEKPCCKRCITSGRQCDGYLPDSSAMNRRQLVETVRQLSTVAPVSQALSLYPHHRGRAAKQASITFFDVFRHSTAPSTASFMPSNFWTRELLQLAHTEPAMWHAALSLGALHRLLDGSLDWTDGAKLDALYLEIAKNHGKALTHARELNDPAKLTSLSLALVSVTNMQGRWAESQVHITAAHRLLQQAKRDAVHDGAAEILVRLDILAMTLSDVQAPYAFHEAAWLTPVDHSLRRGDKLQSWEQAGSELYALFRRLILLTEITETKKITEKETAALAQDLSGDLVKWEFRMGCFERQHRTHESWAQSIRLYHGIARLTLKAIQIGGPETRWDSLLSYFEHVVACAEPLVPANTTSAVYRPVSLEPGLVIPLYRTAIRCRHPELRRRAIALMYKLRRQEGMWQSEGAAVCAAKVMAIEEGPLYESRDLKYATGTHPKLSFNDIPWEAWTVAGVEKHLPSSMSWEGVEMIPEEQRVRETTVRVLADRAAVDLSYIMCSGEVRDDRDGFKFR